MLSRIEGVLIFFASRMNLSTRGDRLWPGSDLTPPPSRSTSTCADTWTR